MTLYIHSVAKGFDTLAEHCVVQMHRIGKNAYCINSALVRLFIDASEAR